MQGGMTIYFRNPQKNPAYNFDRENESQTLTANHRRETVHLVPNPSNSLVILCSESPWIAHNKEHISHWGETDHARNSVWTNSRYLHKTQLNAPKWKILPRPICRNVLEDFCCINFGGFFRGFSWRIFLALFPTKMRRKKSGEKIREKIRRPKKRNPRKIRSAESRP